MGKPMFSIGRIPPTPGLVDQFFNDSTGIGDRGEPDARGPWNEGGSWELVHAPAFQELESYKAGTRSASENGGSSNGRNGGKALKAVREKPKTVETAKQGKSKKK
jgi:Mn-containing catalase